jgi:indole-3-glycerol phosphate synthase
LDQIIRTKRQEVAAAQRACPLAHLQAAVAATPRPRNFYSALARPGPWAIHLIAEIKQASPSAGLIRADFDPVQIARTYYQAGASALSVLTDATYFRGRLDYIGQVKQAVPLPVLRKDFILDPYQVYESRAAGADAILLIAEILKPQELLDLLILANELQLTSLIEVHEADTLLQVRSVVGFPHQRYSLLGINNRNLRTQQVDLGTTLRLKSMVDENQLLVSESGVGSRHDVDRLRQAGVRAVLVGETLMRAGDMAAKIAELFGPPAAEPAP